MSRRTLSHAATLASLILLGTLAPAQPALAILELSEIRKPNGDFDLRAAGVAPLAAAQAEVAALGATATWSRFGTIQTLMRDGDFLSGALGGSPEEAARGWIGGHAALFGLSAASVDELTLLRNSALTGSSARVLLFGQVVGGRPVEHEGRLKIGWVDGRIFWAASSSIGDVASLAAPRIGPAQAWLAAAKRVGGSGLTLPTLAGTDGTWTLLDAGGLSHPQRARLVALGLPGAGAVPVYETVLLDAAGGELFGYTAFVDAVSGNVLVGQNRVWNALLPDSDPTGVDGTAQAEPFDGEYPPLQGEQCGPCHGPFTAAPGSAWVRLVAAASSALLANDIVIDVYQGDASCVANNVGHEDSATSPEAAIYEPAGGVPPGDYYVRICPYGATQAPPTNYAGTVTFESEPQFNSNAKWRYFPANPPLDHASNDTRILGCWYDELVNGNPIPECEEALSPRGSHAIPWDVVPATGATSETTTGNNARSSEQWLAFLSPGGPYQPVSTATVPEERRVYDFPWTNEWFESKCDPTKIAHGGLGNSNDIDAAITNLFVLHNQMHDWAYQLGLREREGGAQLTNFGQTPAADEHDFELGNSQAGAADGGALGQFLGRDNANQLTLNDGIPPLSNMYLFQTIGGAIYVPCVDGDFDASVVAHEYGHLIQNRMVDPDAGLSGDQGGAMGESWGDLSAIEFLHGFGLVPTGNENPFAIGPYVTGDSRVGIRNYSLDANPLNYSDFGYDNACNSSILNVNGECDTVNEVHSDGEIWNAVNYDLRQALISKYAAQFPAGDANLQRRCALGELPADRCPGNRRWTQIVHDAFLLVPPQPSMVDARNGYLAADFARASDTTISWPSNQAELWRGFARRGIGALAASAGSDDPDPTPDFSTPLEANAIVTFQLVAQDEASAPVAGQVFAGRFEARATPVADTIASTPLGATHSFVPGTYDFLARADGYGHFRFTLTLAAGASTATVKLPTNWASGAKGASASGDGAEFARLIDDKEGTNWRRLGAVPSVDVETPEVTVSLSGRKQISRAQVSGMLQVDVGVPGDGRYNSVHAFRLWACDGTLLNCSLPVSWKPIFTSPSNAFPSSSLRPLAPDATIRSFTFPATYATQVRFEALHNKCTGTPAYQGYLGQPGAEDNDPTTSTDCRIGTTGIVDPKNTDVRVAELQLFGSTGSAALGSGGGKKPKPR